MCIRHSFIPLMQLRDYSFTQPADNLAYDELLLQLADKHDAGEFIRFWESPSYFVVLGRIGKEDIDVNALNTAQDNIPILRRSSGGGTVLQGKGCLNYTFVLSKQNYPVLNDLRRSYEWISSKVIDALAYQHIPAVFRPISDIATPSNMKISGNAQHRGRNYILHHGTILYDFDLRLVSKYLKMPIDMPEYRNNRHHGDFVTNISIDPIQFKCSLVGLFDIPFHPQLPTPEELLSLSKFQKI